MSHIMYNKSCPRVRVYNNQGLAICSLNVSFVVRFEFLVDVESLHPIFKSNTKGTYSQVTGIKRPLSKKLTFSQRHRMILWFTILVIPEDLGESNSCQCVSLWKYLFNNVFMSFEDRSLDKIPRKIFDVLYININCIIKNYSTGV